MVTHHQRKEFSHWNFIGLYPASSFIKYFQRRIKAQSSYYTSRSYIYNNVEVDQWRDRIQNDKLENCLEQDFNRNISKPVLKKEQSALQYWMRTGFCKIDLRVVVYKLNMGQQLLLLQKRQTWYPFLGHDERMRKLILKNPKPFLLLVL